MAGSLTSRFARAWCPVFNGIAALIADADRYLLATFYQENLKWVQPGQPVEVSLDLYPGQIFAGKVDSIWRANGIGQYLPSDEIPKDSSNHPRTFHKVSTP